MESKKILSQLGNINSYNIGDLMREITYRVLDHIRRHQFEAVFEVKENPNKAVDSVSNIDKEAEKMTLDFIQKRFPNAGILGEEGMFVNCRHDIHDDSFYFTVDPLDGTRAYERMQSGGFGFLISFVYGGEIIGACVGDAMTGEIVFTRPLSENVYRIRDKEISVRITKDPVYDLSLKRIGLRDDVRTYDSLIQNICLKGEGVFEGYQIENGSIGINFAKMWNGELAAIYLKPGMNMPWDIYPCICISEKLGYKAYEILDGKLEEYIYSPHMDVNRDGQHMPGRLIIHQKYKSQIEDWLKTKV